MCLYWLRKMFRNYCASLIRTDWHWPASRSSTIDPVYCSDSSSHSIYPINHSFLYLFLFQLYLLYLVSFHTVSPVSVFLSLYMCIFTSLFHSVFLVLFLSCVVSSCCCSTPLQESQKMQTKLDALTREVFDLQETINWKDKKIAVGGPMPLLWQNMRGNRWLWDFLSPSPLQLFCLSCCLCMMETLRH